MATNDCKPLPQLSEKDIARFWSKIDKRGPDECWPWLGGTFTHGYGRFKAAGRDIKAPRIALFLNSGKDPFPLFACHSCDYPPCCNGRHIFPGTKVENMLDRDAKGRGVLPPNGPWIMTGESHPRAKFTEVQVREIRRRHAAGESESSLARYFRASQTGISSIIRFRTWRHVTAVEALVGIAPLDVAANVQVLDSAALMGDQVHRRHWEPLVESEAED